MIYLDSAATSFQKPASVRSAVMRAMQTMSSPGRGGYFSSRAAEETLFRCRTLAAETFGLEGPERVVFTASATHALNLAIKSLARRGSRVVISGYEHNAVTRPLHAVGAQVVLAGAPLFDDAACLAAFARELSKGADAAVCTAASNVFGWVLPLTDIAALCRSAGVPLIVDAAQSAGVLPLDMGNLGAAFAAMPGHKGLYGPQGTGLLLCAGEPEPLLEGGTGSESLRQEMPDFLPDRLEAGTHNVPGIAGLEAGIRFVRETTPERILRHERELLLRAAKGLSQLGSVRTYLAADPSRQLGVLSFTVEGWESEAVAEALAGRGIAVRAGLHCAPTAHRTAGTLEGGTVRISFSAYNKREEIDIFLRAMRGIAAAKRP